MVAASGGGRGRGREWSRCKRNCVAKKFSRVRGNQENNEWLGCSAVTTRSRHERHERERKREKKRRKWRNSALPSFGCRVLARSRISREAEMKTTSSPEDESSFFLSRSPGRAKLDRRKLPHAGRNESALKTALARNTLARARTRRDLCDMAVWD